MSMNRQQTSDSKSADLPAWSSAEWPSAPAPLTPAISGEVIDGKYLLGDCIAYGGMGVVFAATHLDLDRPVAVKFIRSDLAEDAVVAARFLNEARAVARLRNEHVARVLDFGKLPCGVPYFVMEWLEGADLATVLARSGPLTVAEAIDYVLQACEALAEAHAAGIVHRDIKPENLFVTHAVDGVPVIKVLDFGVSKQLEDKRGRSLTNPSRGVGSPSYMSPEQIKNPQLVDARTDIWSLGIVLYELLTGERPFDGETLPEVCAHVLYDPPRSLCDARPDLPRRLDAVVRHCLQKDLGSRFSDVAELARALEGLDAHSRTSALSIERILNGGERASALIKLAQLENAAPPSSDPTPLARDSRPDSRQTPPPIEAPVTDHARIARIPGERPVWPVVLLCSVALGAAGVTGAHRLGYDVRSALRLFPTLPELHADALDTLQVTRDFTPWITPLRAVARAETELELAPKLPPRSRQAVEQSTDAAGGDAVSEVAPVSEAGVVEPSSTAAARSELRPRAPSERSPYD